MDGNKEEAQRAKVIAEIKMQGEDFGGAYKFALKAQQLFPGLENISHMITVCEVHCSAAVRINNSEDWYKILQVNPTADESTIKKQYRKLALLLHPDKNKFGGAEAAFQFVVEAQRILIDPLQRQLYDMKRASTNSTMPRLPARHPNQSTSVRVQTGAPSTSNNGRFRQTGLFQQRQQPHKQAGTFWTVCPFCAVRYQYNLAHLNKCLICQSCSRYFSAFDVNAQRASPAATNNRPSNSQHSVKPSVLSQQGASRPAMPCQQKATGKTDVEVDECRSGNKPKEDGQVGGPAKEEKQEFVKVNLENTNKRAPSPSSRNGNIKMRKIVASQSSESDSISGEETNVEGAIEEGGLSYPDPEFCDFREKRNTSSFIAGQIWAIYDDFDGMPRFYALIRSVSSRKFRLQYTWLEHDASSQLEIDWIASKLPVACGNYFLGNTQYANDVLMFSHVMSCEKGPKKNTYLLFPRKGEVWALYKGWRIDWSLDSEKCTSCEYEIVEILSDYAPDIGVGVSLLVKVNGFVSVFTRKAKEEPDVLVIAPTEMLRFSHMILSHKMTGEEKEGIPEGSYELDTASLPSEFLKVLPSPNQDCNNTKVVDDKKEGSANLSDSASGGVENPREVCHKKSELKEKNLQKTHHPEGHNDTMRSENCHNAIHGDAEVRREASPKKVSMSKDKEKGVGSPSEPQTPLFQYRDTEFYNFETEKNIDNFEEGQFWALYSDLDGFPKYYAKITKVDEEAFRVHIRWLDVCPVLREEKEWNKKNLPLGCGRFKLLTGNDNTEIYDNLQAFSHLIEAQHTQKNQFEIHPNVDEIWAVYRNWNAEWEETNLESCEYDVAVIICISTSTVKILILEKMIGFYSVFRPKIRNDTNVTMVIPRSEWMRLSHRVPSFLLTEERGGKLRGCWELDPAAVPETLLCTND